MISPLSFIKDLAHAGNPKKLGPESSKIEFKNPLSFITELAHAGDAERLGLAPVDKATLGSYGHVDWLQKASDLANFAKRGVTGWTSPTRLGE